MPDDLHDASFVTVNKDDKKHSAINVIGTMPPVRELFQWES